MTGNLSALVSGAAAKRLSAVEARPDRSNQHEFNGVQSLKTVFGELRSRRAARFVYLGRDEDDVTSADGFVTWYDAREAHATRTEFRLYFPRTDASERLRERDFAIILLLTNGTALIAFAAEGSTAERQLIWLFGLDAPQERIQVREIARHDAQIGFAAREILYQLGIETAVSPPAEESFLEVLLDRFGGGFPSTAEFSAFARAVTPDVDPVEDPDTALIAWIEREEALFRQLERHLVLDRLKHGFGDDVDAFIQFSLGVHNRRKSRVGYALENHLEAVLLANGIPYARGAVTERSSRPDFLFPSIDAYRDTDFPASLLTMVAVKSTCKDRWRQVLAEADRIKVKHLLTLEPGISPAQTDEMEARQVVLVLPRALHDSFAAVQRRPLMTLSELLSTLRLRTSRRPNSWFPR